MLKMSTHALLLLIWAYVCGSALGSRGGQPGYIEGVDGLGDSLLLREVMARVGGDLANMADSYLDLPSDASKMLDPGPSSPNRVPKGFGSSRFRVRQDNAQSPLGREPSLRDQEYLEHSSLWGHQYMQGGAGEGAQRLKPDGSVQNMQVVKTDAVLPAYCNPPNPCPLGYTASDGCLEDFVNTASFSREYQAAQECMCDSEHMFDCPGNTDENEIDALARSIQNEGLMDSTLDRIVNDMQLVDTQPIEGQHKNLVAKKFFTKQTHENRFQNFRQVAKKSGHKARRLAENPYLKGEKLPVVAKKAPHGGRNIRIPPEY